MYVCSPIAYSPCPGVSAYLIASNVTEPAPVTLFLSSSVSPSLRTNVNSLPEGIFAPGANAFVALRIIPPPAL